MTTINEIRYSRLESRWNVEFYKSEFIEIKTKLKEMSNVEELERLTAWIRKGIFSLLKTEMKPFGIPLIKVSELKNIFVSKENIYFISPEKHKENYTTALGPLDIVLSKSGTIGYASIIPENFGECNIWEDIIGIKVLKNKINPYYLIIYLSTKYGQSQLIRYKGQQVQANLPLEPVRNLLVLIPPKPFQEKIEKIVKEAFSKRKLADQKYEQAKQLLEKELGLDKLKLKEEKTFEANFSNLNKNLRFDSEYYKPKYKQITENLKNSGFEVKKLKEVVKISDKKIDPTKEPTKNFRYIEIGDVNISTGEISVKEIYGRDAPPNAKKILKEGDVIISLVRPTRGAITVISTELNNSVGTSAFVVCGTEKPFREYLSIFLKSSLGLGQLEKPISSSMYPTIKEDDVKNLLIPILPKPKQEKISELVRESFSLRKESKNLLEKSKKVVERAIENGTRK